MGYGTVQIGVTGPRGRIGIGDEYHIDTKFSNALSFDEVRDRFDVLAQRYADDGRKIEFSNPGVASEVYSLDMTPEERTELLRRAAAAHSHSQHSNWHSFDYYAPNADNDRWHESAEGAPIYVVGAGGLKIEGGTGGGYGNYGAVIDKNGNVISKSGHGDNSQTAYAGGTIELPEVTTPPITTPPATTPVTGGDADTQTVDVPDTSPPTQTPQQEAVERVQNYKEMSKAQLDAAYDAMRDDPAKARVEGMKMHKAYFNK